MRRERIDEADEELRPEQEAEFPAGRDDERMLNVVDEDDRRGVGSRWDCDSYDRTSRSGDRGGSPAQSYHSRSSCWMSGPGQRL